MELIYLKKIKKITDLVPVIMISGHANVEMAVESLKLGHMNLLPNHLLLNNY